MNFVYIDERKITRKALKEREVIIMKKIIAVIITLVLACGIFAGASANGWTVPGNSGSYSGGSYSTVQAKLIEDLATRSGPSTQYTGCGSYRMKGQYVTVISRAFDNGGVQWAQVEISYGGSVRRMYTGVKRLSISSSELSRVREENMNSFIGYGRVTSTVNPKWGPGSWYATYTDRTIYSGSQVAVITSENGFYQVELYHTDGKVLRCWIPTGNVSLN